MLSLDISHIARRVVIVAGVVSTVACSDDSTAPRPVTSTAASAASGGANLGNLIGVSPVVDGVTSPGEYDGAAVIKFRAALPPNVQGGGTPVTVYIKIGRAHV